MSWSSVLLTWVFFKTQFYEILWGCTHVLCGFPTGKPVAFYSRKLNAAQRHYTTMEKELLSIVETLCEFRTMLYGCKQLNIHTDHKNLTFANLNSQRVLRWRLFLEEFNPIFHHLKGENNTFAGALSRLPLKEGQRAADDIHQATSPHVHRRSLPEGSTSNDDASAHSFSICMDDDDLLHCFLNFPEVTPDKQFALDFKSMPEEQNNDLVVQHLLQKGTYERVRTQQVLPKLPPSNRMTIIVKVNQNHQRIDQR